MFSHCFRFSTTRRSKNISSDRLPFKKSTSTVASNYSSIQDQSTVINHPQQQLIAVKEAEEYYLDDYDYDIFNDYF